MIQDAIRKWLAGNQAFLPGLRLYRQIPGKYPLSIFAGYERANRIPDHIKIRLKSGLTDYLKKHPVSNTEPLPSNQIPVVIAKRTDTAATEKEPDLIAALRLEARALHKRHAFFHSQLIAADTDARRYEIAATIMEKIIPALDKIYDRIRAWKSTGELPAAIVNTSNEKHHKINSVAPRISKLKRLLADEQLDPTKRQKYEKELIDKQIILARLKA